VANAFGQLLSAAPTLNADPRPHPLKKQKKKAHTHPRRTTKKGIAASCCVKNKNNKKLPRKNERNICKIITEK